MSATSFISEHTAEYYLTTNLLNLFERSSHKVIPFYYWKSREGANQSKNSGRNNEFRLVVIYPRRPKIDKPNQSYIELKINELLLTTTNIFNRYQIPVYAGVPLASSLLQLGCNTDCSWFYLKPSEGYNLDLILELSLEDGAIMDNSERSIKKIDTEDIIDLMVDKSKPIEWLNCIDIINKVRLEAKNSELVTSSLFSWLLQTLLFGNPLEEISYVKAIK